MHSEATATLVHPLALGLMLVASLFVASLRRELILLPIIALVCFIPATQRVVILGLDFTMLRLLVMVALARIAFQGDLSELRWSKLDSLVLAWTIAITFIFVIRNGPSAIANRLGGALDVWGMFMIARSTVRSHTELVSLVKMVAILSFPVLIGFTIERATQHNPFSIFGGVPEFTNLREGRLRCQGAFHHPIHAGVFWAGLLPLYFCLWKVSTGTWKVLGVMSATCCVCIIFLSASSTPIIGIAAGLLGLGLFFCRYQIRAIVITAIVILTSLHIVMDAPVWHLIGRIDVAGGSTGYHRYRLIDAAVGNFGQWWLVGLDSTAHWGRQLHDVTNHYILQGIRGGIWTLVLFVLVIIEAMGIVVRFCTMSTVSHQAKIIGWTIGTCILVHVICFLAVSYFQQINSLWWMTVGLAAGMQHSGWQRADDGSIATNPTLTPALAPGPNYLR